jgi:TolB-like protein
VSGYDLRHTVSRGAAVLLCGALAAGVAWAAPVGGTPRALGASDTLTLSVLPFRVDPSDTLLAPLAYGLADLLASDLARSRSLTLVERARMGAILRELGLARAGMLDSSTAPRAGQLLGARRMVSGRLLRDRDGQIVIGAGITDLSSGLADSTLLGRAPLDDILAAEKEVALGLFRRLGVNLTPQELSLVMQRPTANLRALLAYGQGVRAEVNGQYAAAAGAFARASRADPSFANARAHADAIRNAPPSTFSISSTIDRLNRPLESVPSVPLRGVATDPALTGQKSTVIIIVKVP